MVVCDCDLISSWVQSWWICLCKPLDCVLVWYAYERSGFKCEFMLAVDRVSTEFLAFVCWQALAPPLYDCMCKGSRLGLRNPCVFMFTRPSCFYRAERVLATRVISLVFGLCVLPIECLHMPKLCFLPPSSSSGGIMNWELLWNDCNKMWVILLLIFVVIVFVGILMQIFSCCWNPNSRYIDCIYLVYELMDWWVCVYVRERERCGVTLLISWSFRALVSDLGVMWIFWSGVFSH
jgi:hypothetical protein